MEMQLGSDDAFGSCMAMRWMMSYDVSSLYDERELISECVLES